MQDPGEPDHFPDGTEWPPWFFKMSGGNSLKWAKKPYSAIKK